MSIPSKDKFPENVVNPNFQILLNKFYALTSENPSVKSIGSDLAALKEENKAMHLTGHQKDAIHARINNYIAGTYSGWSKKYNVHVHTK